MIDHIGPSRIPFTEQLTSDDVKLVPLELRETTIDGGVQTAVSAMPTALPTMALDLISKVMAEGMEKYPRHEDGTLNWYKISSMSNFDHSISHFFNFITKINNPGIEINELEELSHFVARALMGLEQYLRGK
jgi:hypothetical protein